MEVGERSLSAAACDIVSLTLSILLAISPFIVMKEMFGPLETHTELISRSTKIVLMFQCKLKNNRGGSKATPVFNQTSIKLINKA
jgi:hypothetical protein